MSRTLSVLIVENFVINEGPKWDKVKRGAKIASIIIPGILGGWGAHNANAAQKAADDYKASHISYTNDARMANSGAEKYDDWSWEAVKKGDHKKALDYRDVSRSNANMAAVAKERADRASKLAKEKQIESHVSSAGAGAGATTGAAALLALKKRKKQEKKSLKERLNLVKSGMYLNEESADVIALRNKISQALIILPGLKGSAADKMEDSIRGWEDQINELEKKTTKTLEEASGVERDIKFLTKETAFSYTTDSLFANSFLMFRMYNKKSNLPIGTMSSKNTGFAAVLYGGAIGGGLSAIDNMEKYFKSDKLQSDKAWFYENIAKKGTRVRDSIENFKNIRSSELSNAKKGNRSDLKKVKRAWADAHKSIRDSLNLFNKEHIKQEKR